MDELVLTVATKSPYVLKEGTLVVKVNGQSISADTKGQYSTVIKNGAIVTVDGIFEEPVVQPPANDYPQTGDIPMSKQDTTEQTSKLQK